MPLLILHTSLKLKLFGEWHLSPAARTQYIYIWVWKVMQNSLNTHLLQWSVFSGQQCIAAFYFVCLFVFN